MRIVPKPDHGPGHGPGESLAVSLRAQARPAQQALYVNNCPSNLDEIDFGKARECPLQNYSEHKACTERDESVVRHVPTPRQKRSTEAVYSDHKRISLRWHNNGWIGAPFATAGERVGARG